MAELTTIESLTLLVERPTVETRPPLLLLHGYFSQAGVFQLLMKHFAGRGHACFALNFRGRCGSRPGTPLGHVSLRDFADDAALLAKRIGQPIVLGHSMGGLVAQMIAAEGLVSKAVLLAPAPPRGISVMSLRLALAQLWYLPAILASRPVHPGREVTRSLVMNRVPAAEQDAMIDQLVPDSGRAGREMSMLGVPVDAGNVHAPVFVVGGDEDRFIPLSRFRQIAARYRAPLHVARGHGHMLILEPGWEEIASHIDRWLESSVSSSEGERSAHASSTSLLSPGGAS